MQTHLFAAEAGQATGNPLLNIAIFGAFILGVAMPSGVFAKRLTDMLEPLVTRVLAPNPSALTGPGTNSFLLGTRQVAVIDPGPDIPSHLDAIVAAAGGADRISHILVTHAHLDHSGGVRRLARMTGAPVLAFGDAAAGRSALMARLAELVRGSGRSVVTVVHEVNYAAAWADHVVAMKNGRVVAQGPAEAVLTEPVLSALYDTPIEVSRHDDRPLVLHHHWHDQLGSPFPKPSDDALRVLH